jgi:LysM repeat protein
MRKGLTALMIGALLVVLFGQTAWAAPPAGASTCTRIVHIVRWGENLWRISRWYGTTVEAVAYANGIVNPHRIYAGQRLFIPCAYPYHGGHSGPYYPPYGKCPCTPCNDPCQDCEEPCQDDDDPCQDCEEPCQDDDDPCQDCEKPCWDGQQPCKPGHGKPCGSYYPPHRGYYYIVRWGDTLSGIAWRHRVNMWSIVHANGIANPNCIYAGQRLYIP